MAKRFDEYFNCMLKLSKHIVEGYIIHRALVEKAEEQANASKGNKIEQFPHEPLQYANDAEAYSLKPISSMACFKGFCEANHAAKHVEAFWAQALVVPCNLQTRPITWLELFILYRLRGGANAIKNPASRALTRATADKQLRAFQRLVRRVAERTLKDEQGGFSLKPAKGKYNGLRGVGILGRIPAISGNLCVNDEENRAIALQILGALN